MYASLFQPCLWENAKYQFSATISRQFTLSHKKLRPACLEEDISSLQLSSCNLGRAWTICISKILVCRSMIPQVCNLSIQCRSLRLCLSCLMGMTYAIRFGPVETEQDPLVALAQKRPIDVIYQYTNEAKTLAVVTMIKQTIANAYWSIQEQNLSSFVESELKVLRCGKKSAYQYWLVFGLIWHSLEFPKYPGVQPSCNRSRRYHSIFLTKVTGHILTTGWVTLDIEPEKWFWLPTIYKPLSCSGISVYCSPILQCLRFRYCYSTCCTYNLLHSTWLL